VAYCEKGNTSILLGFKMGRFSSSNRSLLGGFIDSLLTSFRKIRGRLFPGLVLKSGVDSCHEVSVIL